MYNEAKVFCKFNAKFYSQLNRKAMYIIPSLTIHLKITQI